VSHVCCFRLTKYVRPRHSRFSDILFYRGKMYATKYISFKSQSIYLIFLNLSISVIIYTYISFLFALVLVTFCCSLSVLRSLRHVSIIQKSLSGTDSGEVCRLEHREPIKFGLRNSFRRRNQFGCNRNRYTLPIVVSTIRVRTWRRVYTPENGKTQ